jgi:hypothetical protein
VPLPQRYGAASWDELLPEAPPAHAPRPPPFCGPYGAPPAWSAFEGVMYRREWRNPYAEDSSAGRIAAAKRAAAVAVRERRLAAEAAVDAAMERSAARAFRAAEPSWAAIAARARGLVGEAGGGAAGGGRQADADAHAQAQRCGRASPALPLPPAASGDAAAAGAPDVHTLRLQQLTEELTRRREAVAREQARNTRTCVHALALCASHLLTLGMLRVLPPRRRAWRPSGRSWRLSALRWRARARRRRRSTLLATRVFPPLARRRRRRRAAAPPPAMAATAMPQRLRSGRSWTACAASAARNRARQREACGMCGCARCAVRARFAPRPALATATCVGGHRSAPLVSTYCSVECHAISSRGGVQAMSPRLPAWQPAVNCRG